VTPLFALSDPVWLAIVGGINAVVLGAIALLTIIVNRHFARVDKREDALREEAKAEREAEAARKADEREQAKIDRDEAVAKEVSKVATEVVSIKGDVQVIHKATNSIVAQLVDATNKAGQQKGAEDERAREDARRSEGKT